VEVDETAPVVELREARIGTGDEAGHLVVAWTARDAHLAAHPVTISTGPTRDGPWSPLVRHVQNSGRCVHPLAKEMPHRVFVRVEAVDQAGNVGVARTAEAVLFDGSVPRGHILGVEVGASVGYSTAITPR